MENCTYSGVITLVWIDTSTTCGSSIQVILLIHSWWLNMFVCLIIFMSFYWLFDVIGVNVCEFFHPFSWIKVLFCHLFFHLISSVLQLFMIIRGVCFIHCFGVNAQFLCDVSVSSSGESQTDESKTSN